MKFVRDLVTRAPRPRSRRIASLNHEAVDDPMEDQAVVKAFFRQIDEIFRRQRCLVLKEFHGKRPFADREDRKSIRHVFFSFLYFRCHRTGPHHEKHQRSHHPYSLHSVNFPPWAKCRFSPGVTGDQ